jgi:hypothetical protein
MTEAVLRALPPDANGDDEGCLKLFDLPTPEQAVVIRHVLGIRKRMQFSAHDLERRRASMNRLAQAKISGPASSSVPDPALQPAPFSSRSLPNDDTEIPF